jgi:transcriptional regulator GlxA family with amidase domain/YHS domain-containing protein
MNRRELLQKTVMFGLVAVPFSSAGGEGAINIHSENERLGLNPLTPPTEGSIPVAFLVSEGAVVIDFCGPWEVFQDVSIPGRKDDPFRLYTVAETTNPIHASGGMKIIPDYTFETAPAPRVIVIPAQNGRSEATLEWIRKSTKSTDVTMSVCSGAFLLAQTGLLSGRAATTFHSAFNDFAKQFPDIRLKRGARFVEDGNLASSGGLSSGIDLALRVVERYYGHEVAKSTAYVMEYQGQGWMNPDSNSVYSKVRSSTDEHPICPVCDMDVDPKTSPNSVYKGKTYYFCMPGHKQQFDATPEKFVKTS